MRMLCCKLQCCACIPHSRNSPTFQVASVHYMHEASAGDFWHVRGALPVEPLNAVLREIETWRQPTLMLVGNHDQVSVGGLDHALHPLAAACSAIHILEEPTLYRYAIITSNTLTTGTVRATVTCHLVLQLCSPGLMDACCSGCGCCRSKHACSKMCPEHDPRDCKHAHCRRM